jgi:Ca-activated chloride channel family protein
MSFNKHQIIKLIVSLRTLNSGILLVCIAHFQPSSFIAQEAIISHNTNEGAGDEPTRILFVFDASNSMNTFWSGERKIKLATRLLSSSLASLYGTPNLEVGLRVYGHGTKHVTGLQDCDDTELIVPIKHGTSLIIKQELSRLRAQGTTPIARSLERAGDDFPDSNGRNVIILITDGIEACDEDPCAVSRMLQVKGIVVKPFVIGIGIEDKYKESLKCVGNFYDASDPEVFEEILDLVLEQALHNTTVHVELIGDNGISQVTDIPLSFTNTRTGIHEPQVIHTLGLNNQADTFYLDPLPTYKLVIHSLPQRGMDSIYLSPGTHNTIRVPKMSHGVLTPKFSTNRRTDYGHVNVDIHEAGVCESFFSMKIGGSVTLLTGRYDLFLHTTPPTWVTDIVIYESDFTDITISSPGSLMLQSSVAGYGSIIDATTLAQVVQFQEGNPSGRYTLQPGTYTLIFRARQARSSSYSIKKTFTISSGSTHNLNLHD